MPRFNINVPIEVTTPVIDVEVTPINPLRVGKHVFQLVVRDDAGNESAAVKVEVMVIDSERPTAVLEPVPPVTLNKSFRLNGEKSFDVGGGRIAAYIFTYLGPLT